MEFVEIATSARSGLIRSLAGVVQELTEGAGRPVFGCLSRHDGSPARSGGATTCAMGGRRLCVPTMRNVAGAPDVAAARRGESTRARRRYVARYRRALWPAAPDHDVPAVAGTPRGGYLILKLTWFE